jgi:hypothetical protein
VQTAIVSIVALGALLVVVRRVVGAIRPPKGQVACPSCASGSDACGQTALTATTTTTTATTTTAASTSPGGAGTSDVQPLVLVRSKPH